ncbi:G/U mismatch-specific DNA glycosylase [Bailinhaonella thermotolerans]|uniref:G/U mismatch-specific DNA glycosylase n=1 Tax=Bailinhaonella thermotolerans TaxID=1070861 RepID=A0A3A4B066_9ACTN|nr:G/U mismatch-specific DNA glycosylase [Bailinhaonella thermotolerans]RJL34229.1 G/U mismatch-specific DNA glycosylase [Bailinhaonella thermotolerans]
MKREQLEAARDRVLLDVIRPGLDILFCGINPGLVSALTGHHFARPGNRFWPALHQAGITPRQLAPAEQDELLEYGCGVTNLVPRATARADELTREELRAGGERLTRLAAEYRPKVVAVVGVTAYRTAFDRRKAMIGPQEERVADSLIWVLPNPSGLNASWPVGRIAAEIRRMRAALFPAPPLSA